MSLRELDLKQEPPCTSGLGNYLWSDPPDEKNGLTVSIAACVWSHARHMNKLARSSILQGAGFT